MSMLDSLLLQLPIGIEIVDLIVTLSIFAGALLGSFLFLSILKRYVKNFSKRTETKIYDVVVSILRGPVYLFVIVYAGIWLLRFLAPRYPSIATPDLFAVIDLAYALTLVVVGTWVAYKIFGSVVQRFASHLARKTESRIDDLIVGIFGRLGKVVIAVIGLAVVLSILKIDVTGIVAGLGIAGLALALAMQDTLTNMVSSIYIMVDKKYKVGDRIVLASGESCDVLDIGLRATRLYSVADHTVITLPNNEMAKMKIVNWSEPDQRIKLNLPIDVAYTSDVEKVRAILLDIAGKQLNVLKDPASRVFFTSFEQSSLRLNLIVWVDDFANMGTVRDGLNAEIKKRFEKEDIEIPFPTRTIYMKSTG